MRDRAAALVVALALLASAIGFAWWTMRLWTYTVDDSFITFRYAENLVRGWGLTFNHAPPRAEGYTSILWTLLMAVPHVLGLDAERFSKLLGLNIAPARGAKPVRSALGKGVS